MKIRAGVVCLPGFFWGWGHIRGPESILTHPLSSLPLPEHLNNHKKKASEIGIPSPSMNRSTMFYGLGMSSQKPHSIMRQVNNSFANDYNCPLYIFMYLHILLPLWHLTSPLSNVTMINYKWFNYCTLGIEG